MPTATSTLQAITDNKPLVEVFDACIFGSIDDGRSAHVFCDSNFRHLINRRLRWSECEAFVRLAVQQLVEKVNPRTKTRSSEELALKIDTLVNQVRRAANRRLSYNSVAGAIEEQTADLICLAILV